MALGLRPVPNHTPLQAMTKAWSCKQTRKEEDARIEHSSSDQVAQGKEGARSRLCKQGDEGTQFDPCTMGSDPAANGLEPKHHSLQVGEGEGLQYTSRWGEGTRLCSRAIT